MVELFQLEKVMQFVSIPLCKMCFLGKTEKGKANTEPKRSKILFPQKVSAVCEGPGENSSEL